MEKNVDDNVVFLDMAWSTHRFEQKHIGPPLNFVSEKLEKSILGLHSLYRSIDSDLAGSHIPQIINQIEIIKIELRKSIRSSLLSYLALNDKLNLSHDNDFVESILNFSNWGLKNWFGDVWNRGPLSSTDI